MKQRILFILHLPPPVHGAAMMGKYVHDSYLLREEFDEYFINLTLARDLNDIGKGGFRKLINFLRQLFAICRAVCRVHPQLCYVTPNAKGGAFYKDFVIVMLLKALKQKIVVHYHNKGVSLRQDKIIDNFLYRNYFRGLKVILLSEALYSDVQKFVSRKDIYICPNGISPCVKVNNRKQEDSTLFKILFLSNMMKEKGVWDLVDACAKLKAMGYSFQCNFVGKWSDITEDMFLERISALELNQYVVAHGPKYGDEKLQYWKEADCFVLPTHNECFPLVLLEAMEQGIACVSTREGGVPTIIDDGKTGFLFPKSDSGCLADKIAYLMAHPEVCSSMGTNGRTKFEKEFTLEKFENNLSTILKACLLELK